MTYSLNRAPVVHNQFYKENAVQCGKLHLVNFSYQVTGERKMDVLGDTEDGW